MIRQPSIPDRFSCSIKFQWVNFQDLNIICQMSKFSIKFANRALAIGKQSPVIIAAYCLIALLHGFPTQCTLSFSTTPSSSGVYWHQSKLLYKMGDHFRPSIHIRWGEEPAYDGLVLQGNLQFFLQDKTYIGLTNLLETTTGRIQVAAMRGNLVIQSNPLPTNYLRTDIKEFIWGYQTINSIQRLEVTRSLNQNSTSPGTWQPST
jgi:hypothetical protein